MDKHNKKLHNGDCGHHISLENTWRKNSWEHIYFDFILALIKFNDFLEIIYPSKEDVTFLDFMKRLTHDLIFNYVDETDQDRATKENFKTCSKNQP